MYVLITYDVETATPEGRKRLRHVAKLCEDWGQRVQNSVFECKLDPAQLTSLRARLVDIINEERDSLRFYNLGNNWQRRVEHFGAKPSIDPDAPLIL
jgi:CRISPR-associated protein Cas2